MTRFSAETLDLSRFPAPLAIRGIDYEAILSARKSRFVEIATSKGLAYDVQGLETDPVVIVEETDAYREMLVVAAVNDAVRAVMIAFAIGADLEHLAAFYGVSRRIVGYETTGDLAPILESDDELRRRTLLAPEAFAAAGPRGAYVFHALSADPRVVNVDVWTSGPGKVEVAVQSREGDGAAPDDLVEAVRARLHRDDIKPLTDMVSVRSIANIPYQVIGTGYVLPGPDPIAVRDQAIAAIEAMAISRRTPARDVPRSAVFAAASVGPMDKVVLDQPVADVARGYGEVALLTAVDFKVVSYAG